MTHEEEHATKGSPISSERASTATGRSDQYCALTSASYSTSCTAQAFWSQHLKHVAYALDFRDGEANSLLVCCQQGKKKKSVHRTGYAGMWSLSAARTQKPSACLAIFLRARLQSARRRSPLPVDKAGLLRTASVQACAQAGRSAASQQEPCMLYCCRAARPLSTTANNRRASHMILIRIESLAWPAERTAVVYSHNAQHSRLAQLGISFACLHKRRRPASTARCTC